MSEEIMNEAVTEETPSVSKSKAKRDARAKEAKAEKAKGNFDKILGWGVGILIALVVIGCIVGGIVTSSNDIQPLSDYSGYLTEEGYIEGADLSKVADLDLENLVVPYASVMYLDDQVNLDILNATKNYAYFDDSAERTVENGNTIELDYSGSIDGVKFDGGTAEHQTLQIGSGQFIDNFEEQLIGAHPGDEVTVNVTFPDPYDSNPDLAGKPAVFECKVNSIYTVPELTDELVKEHFSDYGSNVEELQNFVREQGYKNNLETYIANYINDNASVSKTPSAYTKHMRGLTKYSDQQTCDYYNQMTMQYYGMQMYTKFDDYVERELGIDPKDYNQYLKDQAIKQTTIDMTYEALFKKYNLTVSEDTYNDIIKDYGGESQVENYGEPYLRQVAIKYTVITYLENTVTIDGK